MIRYLDYFDTFGEHFDFDTFKNDTFERAIVDKTTSISFGSHTRNDSRNVDGRILLLSSHNVKSKTFVSLWKLNYSRMGMAFAGCKSCDGCLKIFKKYKIVIVMPKVLHSKLSSESTFIYVYYLGSGRGSDFRISLNINCFVNMFVYFTNSIQKFGLEDFL